MTRRPLRSAVAALAVAASALFAATPASAGVLVASAPDCDDVRNAQVFAPWLDPALYFLAPGGGFEPGTGPWTLDGAEVVEGSETFEVAGPGTRSLQLSGTASATSPVVCVGIERPTIRFFVRQTAGSPLSSLRADVHFEDAFGTTRTLPVGTTTASGGWQPSPVMPVLASLLPLLPGEKTPVRFTFTADGGTWQVDDVHVDPYGTK